MNHIFEGSKWYVSVKPIFSEFTILGESSSEPLIQKLPEAVFRKQPSLHESCVF